MWSSRWKTAVIPPKKIPGGERVSIGALNNKGAVEKALFMGISGVKEVIPVTRAYKQVSREFQPDDTVITVGDAVFADGHFPIIAGPCAIESAEQALTIARAVRTAGAVLFRGGAYKPRTSPYSFQGMGLDGLKILAQVREKPVWP